MWVDRVPQDEKVSRAQRCLWPNTIDCKGKCKSDVGFYTNYLILDVLCRITKHRASYNSYHTKRLLVSRARLLLGPLT